MATAKDPELPKPQVHVEDMDKEKVEAALDAARRGVLAIMKNEKRQFFEVAKMIKIEFDKKFGGAWHVLVGKHFGAYVTHEAMGKERAGGLIYFHIGQAAFLIFRHG